METEQVQTETPQPQAPAQTPTAPPESDSIADHQAQFGPGAKPEARTDEPSTEDSGVSTRERDPKTGLFTKAAPQKPERHRAAKQQASVEDVPKIAELTRRLRETERERDELRTRTAATIPKPTPVATPTATFTKAEPKLEQFATETDPYAAWLEAKLEWKIEKREFESQQAQAKTQAETAQRERMAKAQEILQAHQARIAEFAPTKPDWDEALDRVEELGALPDLLAETIITDDKSAELVYSLATRPDVLASAIWETLDCDVTDRAVALLRRRLHTQLLDAARMGQSGAPAAAAPVIVAPKPPTPLRTGPLKTGDEPPGDSDSSISNHEKFYAPKKR